MPRISALPSSSNPQEGDLVPVLVNATNTTSKVSLSTLQEQTGYQVYNVMGYGAKGDGATDDSTAIQAAINAAQTNGGGTIFFPANSFLFATTLTVTLINLTSPLQIIAYGATLNYTGSSDALIINTNEAADLQYAQRSLHCYGLHILGTSSATSGIRNYGASFCTFKDTVLENFTNVTGNVAALIIDARFDFWVEENHFDSLDIRNCGYGILFVSEDDSAGVAASCANNKFTNVHIWVNVVSGKGIRGIGLGGTGIVQVARCVFDTIVIHVQQNNIIAYDFSGCYMAGSVLLAPSVDVFGSPTGLTGWKYTYTTSSDILTLIGPTIFPNTGVATWFTGGGNFNVVGGNLNSTTQSDASGNFYTGNILATNATFNSLNVGTFAPNNLAITSTASIQTLNTVSFNPTSLSVKTLAVVSSASLQSANATNFISATASIANLTVTTPKFPTTPTSGYLLQSDSSGNGTWQPQNIDFSLQPIWTTGNPTFFGSHIVYALASGGQAGWSFHVPPGYTLTTANVISIAQTTSSLNFTANMTAGPVGSAFNLISNSLASFAVQGTNNQFWSKSITSLLLSLASFYNVGVQLQSTGGGFQYIHNLELQWTHL